MSEQFDPGTVEATDPVDTAAEAAPLEVPEAPVTGDVLVDEVLQRLTMLPGLGASDQVEVFESVHAVLVGRLTDVGS